MRSPGLPDLLPFLAGLFTGGKTVAAAGFVDLARSIAQNYGQKMSSSDLKHIRRTITGRPDTDDTRIYLEAMRRAALIDQGAVYRLEMRISGDPTMVPADMPLFSESDRAFLRDLYCGDPNPDLPEKEDFENRVERAKVLILEDGRKPNPMWKIYVGNHVQGRIKVLQQVIFQIRKLTGQTTEQNARASRAGTQADVDAPKLGDRASSFRERMKQRRDTRRGQNSGSTGNP